MTDFSELRSLLDAVCEETITEVQMERLEEMVLADPEAEAFYVQYMSMFAELHRHFAGREVEDRLRERLEEQSQHKPFAFRVRAWARQHPAQAVLVTMISSAGLAAAILLAILSFHSPTIPGNDLVASPGEPIDRSVAVLAQAADAVWEDTGMATSAGSPLPPGRLRLRSGLARIEFYSGAIVILKGPAELELISGERARCVHGVLHASVPAQAVGFTIDTPGPRVVDRGTEFGVAVGASTEVHVFKGKVELHAPSVPRELTTGQGVRVGAGGADRIDADASRFVSAEQLAERLETETQRRQQAWLAASRQWRTDPGLLLYYPFDDEPSWRGTLHNQSAADLGPRDGAVIGCQWVEGR
jgi:hypothetical protein